MMVVISYYYDFYSKANVHVCNKRELYMNYPSQNYDIYDAIEKLDNETNSHNATFNASPYTQVLDLM